MDEATASVRTRPAGTKALTSPKRSIAKLGLALGATVVFLFLAELTVRVLGLTPTRWTQPRHVECDDKRNGLDLYPLDADGEFDVDLREPGATDAQAMRGLDVAEYAEHTPLGITFRYSTELCRGDAIGPAQRSRLLVVGDSFAEGQGVREGDTFSAQLARMDDTREVLNCGRRGYDVSDVHDFLTRRLSLAPDVVVYAYTLNDPEQSASFAARQTFLDDWILDRRRMVSGPVHGPSFWEPRLWSALSERLQAAEVAAATTRWYREMVGEPNADGWRRTLDHIGAMDGAVRAQGGRFLVVIQPLLVQLDGDYPFSDVHQVITEALQSRDIEVLDTLSDFRGLDASSLWVHPSDRHPNARAHAILAEAIDDALDESAR